jgi:hypothetical protein
MKTCNNYINQQGIEKLANGSPRCTHCSTGVKDANDGLPIYARVLVSLFVAQLLTDVYSCCYVLQSMDMLFHAPVPFPKLMSPPMCMCFMKAT